MTLRFTNDSFFVKRQILFILFFFVSQLLMANWPDLKLENFSVGPNLPSATPTSISVDLINTGTNAVGQINVIVFLSEDSRLSQDDVMVGDMTHYGYTEDTVSLTTNITIPNIRSGKFYLIFDLDPNDNIIESNELNNRFQKPIQLEGIESDVSCSFIKPIPFEFSATAGSNPSRRLPTVLESTTGYNIKVPQHDAYLPSEVIVGNMQADLYGNAYAYDSLVIPVNAAPNYEAEHYFGNNIIFFKYETPTGDIVFNTQIELTSNNTIENIYSSIKVFPWNNGYLLFGTFRYDNGNNGTGHELFSIITDAAGNSLSQNFMQAYDSHGAADYLYGDDGSIYIWTSTLAGFQHMAKIDTNGEIAFVSGVAGSTGSWLQQIKLDPNEDYFWGRIGSNQYDRLARVNTETGETVIEYTSSILSAGSFDGDDSFIGLNFDVAGNILIAQRFAEWANDPFKGFELGLMSPDFEMIWEHRIDWIEDIARIYSLGEVSTGYLFMTKNGSGVGEGNLIKVALDGTLTTDCEDENISSGSLSCDLNYTFINNQLVLGGDGMNAPHVKIKVFDGDWNFLKLCLDCGNTIDLPDFDEGDLIIDILLMEEDWTPICEAIDVITVQSGGPCVDNDNDGVCVDQDCDDNNASLPAAPGSSCNDGNSNTENDVIQADGCSCAGTPIYSGCDFTVSTSNNSITISGLYEEARSKIYTEDYEVVWKCNPWGSNPCSALETVANLTEGATYYVSIKSDEDDCEEWIEVVIDGGGNNDSPDLTGSNFNFTAATILGVGDVLNFDFNAANIGTQTTGSFTIKSFVSTNPTLDANDIQDGTIPTGNWDAGYAIDNLAGALTVPDLPPGEYYVIIYLDADEAIDELSENNNFIVSSETFTIEGDGNGCTTSLNDFTHMGSYGGHDYFLSDDITSWLSAKAAADNIPEGYLASINDADENEFIRAYLDEVNEKVFIGLNDADGDGNYEWDNGDPLTYTNPSENWDEPFMHIQFWDGEWSSDGEYKFRKFIVEVPCNTAFANANAYSDNDFEQQATLSIEQLFPNPVSDALSIPLNAPEAMRVQIKVYDQLGTIQLQTQQELQKSYNLLQLPVHDLPRGVHFLQIYNDEGFQETLRFVKM